MLIGPIEGNRGSEGDKEVLKRDLRLRGNELVAKTGPEPD